MEPHGAALSRLTVKELQMRYADPFGETTAARNKAWLVKRIDWKVQAAAPRGLSVHVLNQTSWSLFSLQY
ncbi:DUF2924 domain-containing protein [Limnoglobus roseus]|nr:DUF2924 domain-containing protein [Limnoglobus roseus]